MRYVGVDVASERHVVAAVDAQGEVLLKPTAFGEDAGGYQKLLELLASPEDVLLVLEATGTTGKTSSPGSPPTALRWHSSIRCAPGASPRRTCSAPRRTPSTPWAWRVSPSKSARLPRACRSRPRRSCVSWCATATASCRSLGTRRASCTASSTWAFPNSPATGAGWTRNWPPRFSRSTPPPAPSPLPGRAPSRTSSTTGGTSSASSSPRR
ncbi:transposase [Simulacricoccus sp. 17bor-14]|nr:transposase [Simulacricoccus sp. 17bor-14]